MRAGPVLAALLLSSGCASLPPAAPAPRALAPAEAVGDRSFQQVLQLRRGEREHRLIAAGELCDGRLALSLLSPEGLEVLRLRQRGERVRVLRRRGLPDGLSARAILADFQLVHWPAQALRAAWGPAWRLQVDGRVRRALSGGEVQARVRYTDRRWGGPVTLSSRRPAYELRVTTLEHRPADAPGATACPAAGTAS